jgi:hypothetical protein
MEQLSPEERAEYNDSIRSLRKAVDEAAPLQRDVPAAAEPEPIHVTMRSPLGPQ